MKDKITTFADNFTDYPANAHIKKTRNKEEYKKYVQACLEVKESAIKHLSINTPDYKILWNDLDWDIYLIKEELKLLESINER